jgi:hypothetical protein
MPRPVKLSSGQIVHVDAFHLARTYAGLLVGKPTADLNERVLRQEAAAVQRRWGQRPMYLVPPAVDQSEPDHPRLPDFMLSASLYSHTPAEPGNHGSELVVIWLRPEPGDEPLDEVIAAGVREVPWSLFAGDFQW